jgi:DNA topoisomerase-3
MVPPPTRKILCVAEKNDAAKNIASILSGGRSAMRNGPATYNKLYCFDMNFQNQLSSFIFTSVSGHLMTLDFPAHMKNWSSIPINTCFTAAVTSTVPPGMKTLETQLM